MRSFGENDIRYIEMIQGVVTRMGTNCFSLKSWTITLVAGILALSSTVTDKKYVSIALIPVLVFWFLDTYYLQLERKYRALIKHIRENDAAIIDFELNPKTFIHRISERRGLAYFSCFFSNTELFFFAPIGVIVFLFLKQVI